MASNTIVINNGTGQQVLDQLNAIFPAISSMQYGSTDPYVGGYAVAGMWWMDTGNNLIKQRNSANTAWLTQGTIDAATGAITWNNANIATTLQTAITIGVSGVTGTAQPFDGSSNITIPITEVPATLLTGTASISTTGNAATATTAVNATYGIPVGMVIFDTYLHTGYVKANGATVNRADYPRLATLATAQSLWTSDTASNYRLYGTGNGSTTMVLPNWVGRMPLGANTGGGTVDAGLPNITGSFDATDNVAKNQVASCFCSQNGCIILSNITHPVVIALNTTVVNGTVADRVNISASASNSIYGASTTVQPPAINVIPQIKY